MAKKFPDLSGDGKVTKKDILMGRGVVKKRRGGKVTGRSIGPAGASIVSDDGKRIKQLKKNTGKFTSFRCCISWYGFRN